MCSRYLGKNVIVANVGVKNVVVTNFGGKCNSTKYWG